MVAARSRPVVLAVLVAATLAFGEESYSQSAPPVAQWAQEAAGAAGAFPRLIVFVSELPAKGAGDPDFLPLDAAEFNKAGYFQAVDSASADWQYKLNREALAALEPLAAVFGITRADTVILAPTTGDWKFVRAGEDGKPVTLATAPRPKSVNPKELMAWIPLALGWDGVVIDRRGEYLLVGSTIDLLSAAEIQALAVSGSAEKFALTPAQRTGAGLLSLSDAGAGIGVFDIVFLGQGVKELPVGTKLIIEKKKK